MVLCYIWISSFGAELKSNQKTLAHAHDAPVTIGPMGMSCQASHYCSLQGSQLGLNDDYFLRKFYCLNTSPSTNGVHSSLTHKLFLWMVYQLLLYVIYFVLKDKYSYFHIYL